MQYKTIILELIRQNEPLHLRLKSERKLLATVEQLALELKTSHEQHGRRLAGTYPANQSLQVSQQAFDSALAEMVERLLPASPTAEDETALLDNAMAFVLSRSPRK